MTIPTTYSFNRYLSAKKSVDDRALNRHVLGNLVQALSNHPSRGPLQVLEVGAGIGTMVERLLAWRVLNNATYTGVDRDPQVISEARRRLPRWAATSGYDLNQECREKMHLGKKGQTICVEFEAIEIGDFVAREEGHRSWNLLVANAFLDLVEVASTLPVLFALCGTGGLFYFTLNFDGVTIFEPEIDPALDTHIISLYHGTMDRRVISGKPSGDSRTGRHLFANLRACGAEVLDAGSSDWAVFHGPGGYLGDEAYFLHHIIRTVQTALDGHPNLDAKLFASWIKERHNQVEQGTLIYIAHQFDFLGRVP
jgi:hypothetical protein